MNSRAFVLGVALAIGVAGPAQGAELRILAAAPVKEVATQIAADFARSSGTRVTCQYASAGEIARKVSSNKAAADILVLPPSLLNELAFDGKISLGRRAPLGRDGLALIVKAGMKPPEVAGVDALKKALLTADTVAVCNPKTSVTGQQTAALLRKLAIADVLRAHLRYFRTEGELVAYLAKAKGSAVGIVPMSVGVAGKRAGVQLAGRVPAEQQSYTTYFAAIVHGSRAQPEADALLSALSGPAGRERFTAAGFEAVP